MEIKKVKLKDGFIGVAKIKFYSFAATYLIYGDLNGLHDDDIEDTNVFYSNLEKYCYSQGYKKVYVVSCDDDIEFNFPELFDGLKGDVITYTVHFYK